MTSLRVTARAALAAGLLMVAQFVAIQPAHAGPTSGSGLFRLKNYNSQKCLDQTFTNNIEHPEVIAFDCTGGTNQMWYIEQWPSGTHLINARSGKCLDQNYTNGVEHPDILAWHCSVDANQVWNVLSLGTGGNQFRVRNTRSGNYLDQDYTNNVEHQAVLAYPFKGDAYNQIWLITEY
ncbi:RICIN domain-containing protein [Catenuloplanes sp. NPDC051500]|uniref:RICIN domain-containing protein n=1 Tax=Catenuloplanes sp. NPDC051500 TaxID=3363959 RepID=UPI0037A5D218